MLRIVDVEGGRELREQEIVQSVNTKLIQYDYLVLAVIIAPETQNQPQAELIVDMNDEAIQVMLIFSQILKHLGRFMVEDELKDFKEIIKSSQLNGRFFQEEIEKLLEKALGLYGCCHDFLRGQKHGFCSVRMLNQDGIIH